jgi:hypothetical protein
MTGKINYTRAASFELVCEGYSVELRLDLLPFTLSSFQNLLTTSLNYLKIEDENERYVGQLQKNQKRDPDPYFVSLCA